MREALGFPGSTFFTHVVCTATGCQELQPEARAALAGPPPAPSCRGRLLQGAEVEREVPPGLVVVVAVEQRLIVGGLHAEPGGSRW